MTNTEVTNNVFTDDNSNADLTNDAAQKTTNTDLTGTVAELVGEGKKFKTVEALAASVKFKDEFIETLKAEKQEAQNAVEKANKSDEVFNKLLESKEKENTQTSADTLTADEIQKIVQDTLVQTKTQDEAVSNIEKANDTLVNKLGSLEKAQNFLKEKSNELGLNTEFLMSTAAKSPAAFLKVVGVDEQIKSSENNNIMSGTVNTESQTEFNSGVKEGTIEYYNQMYKTDPKKYMSASVQADIMKYAAEGTYKA